MEVIKLENNTERDAATHAAGKHVVAMDPTMPFARAALLVRELSMVPDTILRNLIRYLNVN